MTTRSFFGFPLLLMALLTSDLPAQSATGAHGDRNPEAVVRTAGDSSQTTWTPVPPDEPKPHGRVHRSVISQDGTTMVLGFSPGKAIEVWDLATRELLATLTGHQIEDVAVSADGSRVVSGGGNETWIWDVESGRRTAVLEHESKVMSVAMSRDGSRIASADQSAVQLWDAKTGSAVARLDVDNPRGTLSLAGTLVSSDGGDRVALGSADGTIRVWDATSGALVAKINAAPKIIWALAFSPDGTRLVAGSADRAVRVWDVASGEMLLELFGHEDDITTVTYSPDGARLFSGAFDTEIRVWDAASGDLLLVLGDSPVPISAIGFNALGTEMISLAFDEVRMWGEI